MVGAVLAPVLPEMIRQLKLDPALAGNLVSIHCLTIALFSPPLGILADRIGRLPVLVPSLVLYALFGTAEVFVPENLLLPGTEVTLPAIALLFILRGLLGAATGGIAAASLGLLGNMYEGEARSKAMGYATSALTIAGIIYPLLGGLLGSIQWRYALCLYAIGLPLALLASFVLREGQSKHSAQTATKGGLKKVLQYPPVLWQLVMMSLASVVMYAVVVYAPMYLKAAINAKPALNGIVLASRAIGAGAVSGLGTGWILRRFGNQRAVAIGFVLMAITLATIPLLRQPGLIIVAAICFGVGFGIVLPSLYSRLADLTPAHLRSSVLSAGTGAGFLGQFLSPILLGPVLHYLGLIAVFYAAAGIALSSGLLLLAQKRV
jgi:MFS family permease